MGQLPAGPAVPVGLGWHPAADDLAAAHAYLPAQAALATGGELENRPRPPPEQRRRTGEEPPAGPAGDRTIRALASQQRGQ
jgi:hypothetical protein